MAVDQIPDWRQVALLAESVQEWLQSMPELTPALCRLDELAKIDRDNYPYGGEHTSERAVMAAKTFLMLANVRYRESVGAGIVPYFIGPVPDGGVATEMADHAGSTLAGVSPTWWLRLPVRGQDAAGRL